METTATKESRMIMSDKTTQILIDIICYLFFLLFLYSAVDKLYDYEKFRAQLGQSPLLTNFAAYVAWLVPLVEILIAVLLIVQKTTLTGLYASFSIMVMFTAYIFVIMNYSEYIPCSCNGILEGASWGQHLAFNIVFVFISIVGVINHGKTTIKNTHLKSESGETENL